MLNKKIVASIYLSGKKKKIFSCVCEFVLRTLSFIYRKGRTWTLSSACETDQAYFTDFMFLRRI